VWSTCEYDRHGSAHQSTTAYVTFGDATHGSRAPSRQERWMP